MNVIASFARPTFDGEHESISDVVQRAIGCARVAQNIWATVALADRLRIIQRTRALIAEEAVPLAEAANEIRQRPLAESLTAEVLPLADACRFLEREAERLLSTRRLGWRGRPLWLSGVKSEIRREPHGVVLIIGPANYPLFLPAVQTLQALVAGNAVLLKPGDGGARAASAFADILHRAGLPPNILQILPEGAIPAQLAIALGVDKVVLTGSATTGEAVLGQCAKTLTPATVELSGCDAMFVRADADLALVVRAIQFGLRLNNGQTCIAPRRVFVHHSIAAELQAQLRTLHLPTSPVAQVVREESSMFSVISVEDDTEALALCAQSPYSLGATIFSRDEAAAQNLAARISAGVIVINDLIVPTADPRLPFGGRGRSGFGTTRGAEGLLEMTVAKVVSLRRGKSRRHFDISQPGDAELFSAYIRAAHGKNWRKRLAAFSEIFTFIRRRSRR